MVQVHTPSLINNAAFEAHMAAAKAMEAVLGRKVKAEEVARALATAYGDAMGIVACSGANAQQIAGLNLAADEAFQKMINQIVGDSTFLAQAGRA